VLLTVDGAPVTVTDVRDEKDFNFAVDANGIFGAKPGIYRLTAHENRAQAVTMRN
jgi:hypothetical protein